MITYPGRAPSVLEARLIKDAFFKMVDGDVVIRLPLRYATWLLRNP